MFCSNCGAKLPDGVKFCPSCGTKVNAAHDEHQHMQPETKLVPAKCTNCGAALEVDPDKDAAICPYCNTPYIVSKAIQNYKITNINIGTQINIEGVSADNLMKLADSALSSGKYREAVGYADRALEAKPECTDAWIIKIKAAGYDIEGDRSSEIASYVESALNYGADDRDEIKIYSAILDVAAIHIGEATRLLSTNTDGINRQLKDRRNKHDIAAMDSGYILKTTKITNEAIEYRNLVPNDLIRSDAGLQKKVAALSTTYQKYCDALESRYALYGSSLSNKAHQLKQDNLKKIQATTIASEGPDDKDAAPEKHGLLGFFFH